MEKQNLENMASEFRAALKSICDLAGKLRGFGYSTSLQHYDENGDRRGVDMATNIITNVLIEKTTTTKEEL